MQKVLIFISTVLLTSCQDKPKENAYYAPKDQAVFENKIYLDLDFEVIWEKIIEKNNRVFEIELKNEDLGKLILKLKPKNILDYIDCGMMNEEIYVQYIDRIFESSLNIETSLSLSREKKNLTSINVISKYIFKSKETGTTWTFKTNESKLILVGNPAFGADPYRKCMPKHFLESSIIREITALE